MEIEEIKRKAGNRNNTSQTDNVPNQNRKTNGNSEDVEQRVNLNAFSASEAEVMERALSQEYIGNQ